MSNFLSREELAQLGVAEYGENVLIGRHAVLYSPEKLKIGNNVRIDDFTIISGNVHLHDYIHISQFCGLYGGDAGIVMEDYSEELLTEPVSGIPAYQFDGDGVIDLTVVSVRLRPGSLMLFYHATNSADYELLFDYYPGGVKVIMLDGTEIILNLSAVGRISEESDSLYWVEYAADVPPVDAIDYINLSDGTKLTVP